MLENGGSISGFTPDGNFRRRGKKNHRWEKIAGKFSFGKNSFPKPRRKIRRAVYRFINEFSQIAC